ncbi:MAG: AarF/ABC1/UbiB kinase family protein, partial [Chloroflexota bacterium]
MNPNADNPSPIDRGRYRRVLWFFVRVIVHLVWWDLLVGRVFKKRVRATRPARFRRIARRFRELAVQMGGVLIKLGQFLSARVDVLPVEITEELVGLQDEVAPVPWALIEPVLRAELADWSAHFITFEQPPLAAASLGQVHRARLRLPSPLPDPPPGRERERPSPFQGVGLGERVSRDEGAEEGPEVVVKVQRPDIVAIVQTDLAVLRLVARWVAHYRPIRRRADVPALMEEFARTLWEELDYVAEASNAERFAEMFATDEGVLIPAVYRAHSTGRILVLEDVGGIKITDVETMRAAGVEPKEVATRLLDTYFQQIFQEGFFHADPHPGNLFVRPLAVDGPLNGNGPRSFQLVFVDFGMVGRIKELMGDNLRRVLVALAQRDAR